MSTWAIPHQFMYSTEDLDFEKRPSGTLESLSRHTKKYLTPMLLLSGLVASMGSSTIYGYNMSKLNTPYHILLQFINNTYIERYDETPTETWLTTIWSIVISSFIGAGAIGSFLSGTLADKFGRKKALLLNHMLALLSAGMEFSSKYAKSYELLIAGRIVIGLNAGLSQGMVSLYLTEITPKEIRGAMLSLHQTGVVLGILLGQILSIDFILGTEERWPYLCAFSCVPPLIACTLLPFCPESPRYLLVHKKDEEECKKALRRLTRTDKLMLKQLEEMKLEETIADYVTKSSNPDMLQTFHYMDLLRKPELRRALFLSCLLNFGQQWSGINAIFAYSHSVFSKAGVQEMYIQYAIIGTGVINVVVTFISISMIERVGRRKLLISPTWILIIASVLICVAVRMQNEFEWLNYVTIGLMLCYVVGFGLGFGPLATMITCETFEQTTRAPAMAATQCVHYISNFTLCLTYKFMEQSIKANVFIIFAGIVLVTNVAMTIFLPETANRSVKEIVKDIRNKWYWNPCKNDKSEAEDKFYVEQDEENVL